MNSCISLENDCSRSKSEEKSSTLHDALYGAKAGIIVNTPAPASLQSGLFRSLVTLIGHEEVWKIFDRIMDAPLPYVQRHESTNLLRLPGALNSSSYSSFQHAPAHLHFFCTIMASKSARSLSSASISAMIGLKYGLSSSGLVCSLAGSS